MIYSVEGKLAHIEPSLAVVECGGVGFACRTTAATLGKLAGVGKTVKLYTYLHVREDIFELFGFATQGELSCFKQLITVSGVGPKVGISILSELSYEQVALCVATGDSKSLTRAPGVGPKVAQRIVLELRDKITKEQLEGGAVLPDFAADAPGGKGNASEAVSALVVLGYAQSDAAKALGGLAPDTPVEEMIRQGLKKLAGY